jgi:hypothetical protein
MEKHSEIPQMKEKKLKGRKDTPISKQRNQSCCSALPAHDRRIARLAMRADTFLSL